MKSGIRIAGLETAGEGEAAPANKKVVYSNKKKGPAKKSGPRILDDVVLLIDPKNEEAPASPSADAVEVENLTPKVDAPKIEHEKEEEKAESVKDEWDASEDEIKDSWDAESEGEDTSKKVVEAKKPVEPKPAAKVEAKPVAKTESKPIPAGKRRICSASGCIDLLSSQTTSSGQVFDKRSSEPTVFESSRQW